ncbi:Uncharacterised protein [Fusobacterium necrophorum subsp. necrophorum]|nr:Uncharacterised protein [Fusobacterium necrophorum subsp. necrophorum]
MIVLSPSKKCQRAFCLKKFRFFKMKRKRDAGNQGKRKYEAWSLYHGLAFRSFKREVFSKRIGIYGEESLYFFCLYGCYLQETGFRSIVGFSKKGLYATGEINYQESSKMSQFRRMDYQSGFG